MLSPFPHLKEIISRNRHKTKTKPYFLWCPDNCPRGKLLPRVIAPMIIAPRLIVPRRIASRIIDPRTIALKIIDRGQFPPGQLPPKKIAFWMICCLHNCPFDNWPRGKLHPRKIVPRMDYIRDISFPPNQKA